MDLFSKCDQEDPSYWGYIKPLWDWNSVITDDVSDIQHLNIVHFVNLIIYHIQQR